MALRSHDQIGVGDPRKFASLRVEDPAADAAKPEDLELPDRRRSPPAEAVSSGGAMLQRAFADRIRGREVVQLAGQPLEQVQIAVPEELQHRLEEATFDLAGSHRKLAKGQTVIAALLWRHVAESTDERRELIELLDRYERSPWAEKPTDKRVAGRIPASLKRTALRAAMQLRRQREEASLRLILSALILEHVHARDNADGHAALVALLEEYDAAKRDASDG